MTAGAAAAGDHAKLVASNFVREIKGQDLQPYKASKLLHFLVNKIYIFDIKNKVCNRNGKRNQQNENDMDSRFGRLSRRI